VKASPGGRCCGRLRRWPLLLALVLAAACGRDEGAASGTAPAPAAIDGQEDAVCGMVVREQPAPRAQVLHADGERAFFCSLGDLLVYLSAPSPHGAVRAVFVEVLDGDGRSLTPQTGPHPWRRADDAVYVVGVARRGIMGAAVLAYADAALAEGVAAAHSGAQVRDFAQLQQWWRARQAAR